jgi:hypothetical protein
MGSFRTGGGGARIKSIQRGIFVATWSIAQTVKTVTISAVDTAKTMEKITGVFATNTNWGEQAFRVELINPTTLQFTRTASSSSVVAEIAWEIVEYYNVKSKQSGVKSSTATDTQTITSVNLSKSIYSVSSSTSSATNSGASYLQNATTIAFRTDGSTTLFAWQVLEFY